MELKKKSFAGRKFLLVASLAAFVSFVTVSCEKAVDLEVEQAASPSKLSISILPQTKATGTSHGIQSDDNNVNMLEIFVFKNEGADAGVLDTYKKLSSAELASLANIQVQTTTGSKVIYAVANSHKDNWTGVNTLAQFKSVLASLQAENLKSFTMVGSTVSQLQAATSVNIDVSRLVARVHLAGIKTAFAGTPYEGSTLKNVKAYLINVIGDASYAEGAWSAKPFVLNANKYVPENAAGCAMTGMLYDEILQDVGDAGYTTPHYFYCYENMLQTESYDNKYTRLVIQADLNGTTYYYPISINREGFGYNSSNGHIGIKRNTSYSLEVTISRPGSLEPGSNLEFGTVTAKVNVLNWETIPVAYGGL